MKDELIGFITKKETARALYGLALFSAGVAVGILYESYTSGDILPEVEYEKDDDPQLTLPFDEVETERVVISARDFVERVSQEAGDYNPSISIGPPVVLPTEPVDQNVFDLADGWDWLVENNNREQNPNEPYVLKVEEYVDQESGFHQETLIYYEGDDILCTEANMEPIYDYSVVIGWLRFGHGSGDPNLFYVRNVERRAEYEIRLMHGKYTEEVLGLKYEDEVEQEELRHSDRPLKFRTE